VAAPIPEEKEVAVGQSPLWCSAWLCPCSQGTTPGQSWLWGRYRLRPDPVSVCEERAVLPPFRGDIPGDLAGMLGWVILRSKRPLADSQSVLLSAQSGADQALLTGRFSVFGGFLKYFYAN